MAVLDLRTNSYRVLVSGGQPAYVNGFLVYSLEGDLWAAPFDLERLTLIGEPVIAMAGVAQSATGSAAFDVSPGGTLVYLPKDAGTGTPRSLVWVDRKGIEQDTGAPPCPYTTVRISPDGRRVATEIRDSNQADWIWDIGRRSLTRLTFDSLTDLNPIWTPDGASVIFTSGRESSRNLTGNAWMAWERPNALRQAIGTIWPRRSRLMAGA